MRMNLIHETQFSCLASTKIELKPRIALWKQDDTEEKEISTVTLPICNKKEFE